MVTITKEMLEEMKAMRRKGATYREIRAAIGVSKWACTKYLRGMEIEQSAIRHEWKKAEQEAIKHLLRIGYEEAHDLNLISPTPYWDILAKKDGEWWLIDVTVSKEKRISSKIPYFVDGYTHSILYKNINQNTWSLMKLNYELMEE